MAFSDGMINGGVYKFKKQIPENFIIGAGSSAWQIEGWKVKKKDQILSSIHGIKMENRCGVKYMDRESQLIFMNATKKMSI